MIAPDAAITIAGAGSIGCYAGGCLIRAGRRVTLLVRPRLGLAIAPAGLRVTDLEGRDDLIRPKRFGVTADTKAALSSAQVILVTVKSRDTEAMGELIERHASPDAIVVSLQNGVDNVDILRRMVMPRQVVAGMVPFNVVQTEIVGMPLKLHRATAGRVLIEKGVPGLAALLNVEGFAVAESGRMQAVQWGKLLMNLNNALNALSGLPLAKELGDRRWRFLLAEQIEEALVVMRARKVKPAWVAGVPPAMLPGVLRLPNWLFGVLARRMLTIDGDARSSMWEDLERGRKTEIDQFQGVILRLAGEAGRDAAWNRLLMEMVHEAEAARKGAPEMTPEKVLGRLRPQPAGATAAAVPTGRGTPRSS